MNLLDWLLERWYYVLFVVVLVLFYVVGIQGYNNGKNEALKEYKDGIQNHLVWSNTGKCFFVRPNDDVTVYLIQVPDCNKGN